VGVDTARRNSLELIDKMASIGGEAAAVARMTEEGDFDLDNLMERSVNVNTCEGE
jgi:hypothetical protein